MKAFMSERTARRINSGLHTVQDAFFPELLVIILPDFISSFCSKTFKINEAFLSVKRLWVNIVSLSRTGQMND